MAESTNKPAGFVPQAAAASQRMADSVFDRLSGGARPARATAADSSGSSETSGRGALTLQTALGSGRPLRARDVIATAPKERAPAAAVTPVFPTAAASWDPPEVARCGLRAREAAEADRPLWAVLPAVQVEPIVAAVESVISRASDDPASRAKAGPPAMPVLRPAGGGDSAATVAGDDDGPPRISRATIDASLRMLDALRAHASMHATAGDSRISLGDMTLIAFAEKKQQMAAAVANATPEPKEPDRPPGHLPNPKVFTNKNSILLKIREIASDIMKKDSDRESAADTRYGGK